MGLAIGCIGMSREDFLQSTPDEFNAIAEAWNNNNVQHYRSEWEQARFIAQFILMPYSKKHLKPQDLVVFEWEETHTNVASKVPTREDFERMKKEYGDE